MSTDTIATDKGKLDSTVVDDFTIARFINDKVGTLKHLYNTDGLWSTFTKKYPTCNISRNHFDEVAAICLNAIGMNKF